MEVKELTGTHILTGFDTSTRVVDSGWCKGEEANVTLFELDGVVYEMSEDPEDGYRSAMKELIVSDKEITNRFPACIVHGTLRGTNTWGDDPMEVLDFMDITTKKIVLSIGTDCSAGYYPYYVSEFHPENMLVNAGR